MEFHGEYGEGTVVTLHLTKDYFGTNRTVHADSAFSLVKTSEVLQSRGLHFMGIVKTAHKGFPKEYIDWAAGRVTAEVPAQAVETTSCLSLKRTMDTQFTFWDGMTELTCGTTIAGLPSHCPRHRKYFEMKNGSISRKSRGPV